MLCPLGVHSPFLPPNALGPVLCPQESSLLPERVGAPWETSKTVLCQVVVQGWAEWGSAQGCCLLWGGHSSCTSPHVMVIVTTAVCSPARGQRGSHPLLPTSLLPARHILSHWLPHSWWLEPFQSLPGGHLWHSQLLSLPVTGGM